MPDDGQQRRAGRGVVGKDKHYGGALLLHEAPSERSGGKCDAPHLNAADGVRCVQAIIRREQSRSVMSSFDLALSQRTARRMLNKVPEVTVYFWIIKILCTTVGESFADYINSTLGFGLTKTTIVFSVALVIVLVAQFRLRAYVPGVYWLAVVLISVVGTLITDILTDSVGVPLLLSTAVFAAALAVVFGVWYARERTLSIHTIVTTPRESFYWLTVLVTFALGTAAGDYTLELTGWGPGAAVLLPAGLIAAVFIAWRLGAGPVLCFWLAYILTRPLGANIGDYLGSSRGDGGLGLGTLGTSLLFLITIFMVVTFLTLTHIDRTERAGMAEATPGEREAQRRT